MAENGPDKPAGNDLDALGRRLEETRRNRDKPPGFASRFKSAPGNALGLAFRVSVELVSALAVGLGIGWLLDLWLETSPWLMIVFIVLGFAAGVLNVYRMASGFGYAPGYQRPEDVERGPGRDDTKGS